MSFVKKAVQSVGRAIGKAVSGVVKAVGSVVSGVVKAVGNVISAVVDFVASPFMGMFGMPDAPTNDSEAAKITGVLVQRSGTNVNVPVVYGFRKIGGIVTFCETGSDNNKYLWVAYVLSEGMVEGLYEMWINDIQVPASLIPILNNGDVGRITAPGNKLSGKVELQFYKGIITNLPEQTGVGASVKSYLFKDCPSWKTTMNYNGLATVFARYEWKEPTTQEESDNNPWSGNIPELKVTLLGRKVASLRSGTPENSSYLGTGYTASYSSNPAEILLDYLRNPYYGKGLYNSDIDWASWKIAAQKCATNVTYITGTTGPILDMHYVLDTGQTIFQNTKILLQNFRAYMPYSDGKYKLIIEDAGNATDILSGSADIVADFTKDNLHGDITYTGIEKSAKYSQVVVKYVDPANFWSEQTVVYPESQAERNSYQIVDGFRENKGEFTFGGITNPAIARDMARLLFLKSREQDSLSFTVSSQGFELEPGDSVYLNANILKFGSDPLQNAIPWRIISIKLNNDFTFSVGCVRNPDWIYPHTRAGEIDYKYAVYVPKGASRYYPAEPVGVPIGYKPPTGAATDANDPNAPPSAPGIGVLSDGIDIYSIATINRGGSIYATAAFNQIATPMYAGIKFWYKRNLASDTTWAEGQVTTRPGPGQPVNFEFGPLNNNTTYILRTRVIYTTGDQSSVTNEWSVAIGTGAVGQDPEQPVAPPANLANNYFSYAFGRTVLNASNLPLSPRKVRITLRQNMTEGNNSYINGLEVFTKPSANPKWNRQIISTAGLVQGQDFIFELNVGSPVYPLVPGSGGTPTNIDNYDFIFRYTYSDGKTSVWQYRAMNCTVEYGAYGYDIYIFAPDQGALVFSKEATTAYVPIIAGPGDVAETRNINVSIATIGNALSAPSRIIFHIQPPSASDWVNWVGIRMYRKKALVTATTTDVIDITPVSQDALGFFVQLPIDYDAVYEYVMVPLVNYGDAVVEAFQGRYISGAIHNRTFDADYPSNGNWMNYLRIDGLEAVDSAKAKLGTATPAPPRSDTFMSTLTSATLLTSGLPREPRDFTVTFKQSITNGVNGRVKGLKIYYKLTSNLYWKEATYVFPTPYTEGSTITFTTADTTPAMDLGFPSYPNLPGTSDNYDFIMRFQYDDDTTANREAAFLNKNIEYNGVGYSFSPLGDYVLNDSVGYRTSTTIVTENNAPPGSVVSPLDVANSLTAYQAYAQQASGVNQLTFWFSKPIQQLLPYFEGFRVYRRPVIGGENPSYEVFNTGIPFRTGVVFLSGVATDAVGITISPTLWDIEYEYAIVPVVWNNRVLTEATKSYYWRGRVHNRETELSGSNPYTLNWFTKRSPELLPTEQALGKLATPFPASDPTVRMQSITRTGATQADAWGYHTIKYQVPATHVSTRIYRRSVWDIRVPPYTYYLASNFRNAGRWERIDISDAANVPDGDRIVTVNLRPAIAGPKEYNVSFNPTLAKSSSNPFYANYTNTEPASKFIVGDITIGGSLITQLLIVETYTFEGTTVTSTKGLLVDLRNGTGDILRDCQEVTVANYNNLKTVPEAISSNANLGRNLVENRVLVLDASIVKPGGGTYTKPTATPPVL